MSARGKAKIGRRGDRYSYQMIDGDPLGLAQALKKLDDYENLDADGFADDDLWLDAMEGNAYPDILRRATDAMTNHVVNRPDVILSLKEGFCYGNGAFGKMIDLLGTHGSASATQSLGMVISTAEPLPDYVRGSNLMSMLDMRKTELIPAETPTATPSATMTPTETPTATATAPPTITPTAQISPTSTPTPRAPAPTITSTNTPTITQTPTITPTPTNTPTITPAPPTATATPAKKSSAKQPADKQTPRPTN